MPPKSKISKKAIIDAALDIVRSDGADAVNARSVAAALGASTQPIFSNYPSMKALTDDVTERAYELYESRISSALTSGEYPPYKASGMAYIQFAKEEKELFKLLFMRDRTGETISDGREQIRPLIGIIMQNLGICEDDAYKLHLELWIYVHGIATMIATSYLEWDTDFISQSLTNVYLGLKHRYTEENDVFGKD